ncbi:aquaporin [Diaporthe sp. PMI_573]|nr:aquaporin [Diaporthaceae sp. PMI_573]
MARNNFVKQLWLYAVEISGEAVGTFLFLLMALSAAQVANSDTSYVGDNIHPGDINLTQLLYISLVFGFSLAVNVSIFARVSGGLFNPAIKGIFLTSSQILGAVVALAVVKGIFPSTYVIQTKLGHDVTIAQGLLIETFLTMLPGIYYTGGSLNPARTFSPDLITLDFGTAY